MMASRFRDVVSSIESLEQDLLKGETWFSVLERFTTIRNQMTRLVEEMQELHGQRHFVVVPKRTAAVAAVAAEDFHDIPILLRTLPLPEIAERNKDYLAEEKQATGESDEQLLRRLHAHVAQWNSMIESVVANLPPQQKKAKIAPKPHQFEAAPPDPVLDALLFNK